MKSRLNITVDRVLIQRAKRYAAKKDTSSFRADRRELESTHHTPSCPKAKRLRIYRDSPETEGKQRALRNNTVIWQYCR